MATALAQYLRIFSDAGTHQRWQSFYVNQTVTWAGSSWLYVPFTADGLTAGSSGDESSITIQAPATASVVAAFELALTQGWLAELLTYEFDPTVSPSSPPADQAIVAQFAGQVVGATATLTRMTIQLGSALAPVGRQVPPRSLTTLIMGTGCRL